MGGGGKHDALAYTGKGRGCRKVRTGKTGGSRALGGESPMGASSFRQQSIQASSPPPPVQSLSLPFPTAFPTVANRF